MDFELSDDQVALQEAVRDLCQGRFSVETVRGLAEAATQLTAGEAAILNGKSGIQVHGAMGCTWEVDAHLYFKRAYAVETLFGSREEWADRLADLLAASV